ncbi:MAG: hypothetical protein QGF21_12615 [Vicinamibacterales bacterium]|jgi:hypothetical protein|nr:hypothetical protein [Acidobacteriota bacterium]MDP7478733.1 hypothetical protein [Vicinamibacterales bacterium]MDP7672776.1 hypothetical protein [Vicinamibacterales bacterium]HJO39772.1 hypothetical protein [Vicinamibacterales bacterium]|tara:strand:- start:2092 stop:2448 length:357 start_codon:yes stop_codon:yes gene_type:complete
MAIFEVESWRVAEGQQAEHDAAMRQWLQWINDHRELFAEWKSVRYFNKYIAGEGSGRYFVVWEYDSLTAFEAYKARRADYGGPYAEYRENDPYYKDVFDHSTMTMEVWNDVDRALWME